MLLIEGADETAMDIDGSTPAALLGSLQLEEAQKVRLLQSGKSVASPGVASSAPLAGGKRQA